MPAFPIPALDLILNLADKNASGRLALSGSRVLAAPSSPSYRIVRADNGRVSLRACLPNLSGERAFDDVDLSVSTVRIALGLPGSNPFCLATLATPFPAAAGRVTTPQSATADLPATKRITLDPSPYAGSFIVTLDGNAPFEVPFDASADQILANAPALHYSIRKVATNAWEISGIEPNQDVTIALDVTGLLVPLGVTGDIALNTQGLADYFAAQASGTPPAEPKFVRLTLEVDIDGLKVYQNDRIEIARELINLSTLVPTPIPPSDYATLSALIAAKQPLNSQLSAISSLLTTGWGRALLTLADAGALRTYASLQPLSAQLTAVAALAGAAYGRGLLTQSNSAALRAYIEATFANLPDKPTTIAGYGIGDYNSLGDARWASLASVAAKAPIDSPVLTGTPAAPTPANATSSTQLATTAFVHALINDLLNASPATLDTLKELADAIGDDPNFAVTVANSIALRLVKAANLSDLTDAVAARANLGLGNVNNTSDANKPVSTAQQAALDLKAALAGNNTFTGQNIFSLLQTFNAIAASSIVASQLANPGAPTVTPIGANGLTTWSYKIVAKLSDGTPSAASPAGSTAIGDDVLDATNKNSLAWAAVPGATSYDVYRTAVGISPATTGKIANVLTNAYVDTGAAGDSTTPPATNATGRVVANNIRAASVNGVFDPTQAPYNTPNDDSGNAAIGLQACINDAIAANGRIKIPGGLYRLTSGLTIPSGLQFEGDGFGYLEGSMPTVPSTGTWFHVTSAAFTPFTIAAGSICTRLRNFGVYHDQPAPTTSWAPTTYPYVIKMTDFADLFLEDIMLLNASHGIKQDSLLGTVPSGRLNIRNLFGQPFNVGLSLEFIADFCRIQDIEFYNFWSSNDNVQAYIRSHLTAFDLAGVQNAQFNKISAYGVNILFDLGIGPGSAGPTTKLRASNIDADNANSLIVARGGTTSSWSDIRIGGGSGAVPAIDAQNGGNGIQIVNFRGDGLPAQVVKSSGANNEIQISQLDVYIWDALAAGAAAFENNHASSSIRLLSYKLDGAGIATGPRFGGTHAETIAHGFGNGEAFVDPFGIFTEPWIAPTLLHGWVNIGGLNVVAQYRKNGLGQVAFRATLQSGTASAGTVIWTFPVGYRPTGTQEFVGVTTAGTTIPFFIDAGGNVTLEVNVNSAYLAFSGTFYTD